jgi:hypothetical protein
MSPARASGDPVTFLSIPQESIMLQKSATFPGIQGPIVTIVMDGYGIAKSELGSAIAAARKPTLDRLFADYPNITLRAHGTAVGMPSDEDMGNSEVGHNAIGAGQVYSQGAALVADAIASGSGRARPGRKSSLAPKPGAASSISSVCSRMATCTATSTICGR